MRPDHMRKLNPTPYKVCDSKCPLYPSNLSFFFHFPPSNTKRFINLVPNLIYNKFDITKIYEHDTKLLMLLNPWVSPLSIPLPKIKNIRLSLHLFHTNTIMYFHPCRHQKNGERNIALSPCLFFYQCLSMFFSPTIYTVPTTHWTFYITRPIVYCSLITHQCRSKWLTISSSFHRSIDWPTFSFVLGLSVVRIWSHVISTKKAHFGGSPFCHVASMETLSISHWYYFLVTRFQCEVPRLTTSLS